MLFRSIYLLFSVSSVVKIVYADYDESCESIILGSGVCINFNDCPTMKRALENIPRPNNDTLRSIYCGHDKDMVCCPYQTRKQENQATKTPSLSPQEDLSNHRNSYLLTRNHCGIPQDPPHDGLAARVNEYPWMALLVYNSESRPYQCGGSVITERYVLTAATCDTHELHKVRVGEHTLSTAIDCQHYYTGWYCASNYQEHLIENRIRHNNYGSQDLTNNIALLRLASTIDLTQGNVMPICLPLDQGARAVPLDGMKMTFIGWPSVKPSEQIDTLLRTEVTLVSNEQCELKYSTAQVPSYLDGLNMMCALANPLYPCRNIPGGPLALTVQVGGLTRYVQYGLASHGAPCSGNLPDVYIRLVSYVSWILNSLQP